MQELDLYSLLEKIINASIKAGVEIGLKIIEYNSSNEIIYNEEELLNPWFLVS